MFIKEALIFSNDQKTDDELKTILAKHPWAPSMIHGLYKSFGGTWEQCHLRHPDAIWIDGGLCGYDDRSWIVEDFHVPLVYYRPLPVDPFHTYERRKDGPTAPAAIALIGQLPGTLPSFHGTGSTGSQVPSPWIKILNQQASLLATLGDRLGLDPKSRASLQLPAARQQKSRFAGLIGQSGLDLPLNS